MDRVGYSPWGRKESDTTERLSAHTHTSYWVSQVTLVVKNLPADAGDIRDAGLVPGFGRSPGGGHGHPVWRIPWTEALGGLQPMGWQSRM